MRLKVLLALALILQSINTASATGPGGLAHNFKIAPAVKFLKGGDHTLAPMAHVVFCLKSPDDCAASNGPDTVDLDDAKFNQLVNINTTVNNTIIPKIMPGMETWTVSPRYGSCHDYAITKRHQLLAAGWPTRALRIAVAITPEGIGHAILVVRTSDGDLVLDNRTSRIVPWKQANLRWIKIESSENPKLWLELQGGRSGGTGI